MLGVVLFILVIILTAKYSSCEPVVSLTNNNFDIVITRYELAFLNFYAEWCRFSQILEPIFEEASVQIQKEFPASNRVLFGKVDCDVETQISRRFHITKYPTMKLFRHGKLLRREYRGQRSVQALTDYIRGKLNDSIAELKTFQDFDKIPNSSSAVVAYLENKTSPTYEIFKKVATELREDCRFFTVNTGLNTRHPLPIAGKALFKPALSRFPEEHEQYPGNMANYDEFFSWATEKCLPLVREITFENAEELTEEGLPFLILFHNADDKESVDIYRREVKDQLLDYKMSVNFLVADGEKFSHPLEHLGKTKHDLPLIAIDSFRHMFVFPSFKDIFFPGKLKEFVEDLHSGKLHRQFHYQDQNFLQTQSPKSPKEETKSTTVAIPTSPPESTFKKLAPSRNRYTLLRDEL